MFRIYCEMLIINFFYATLPWSIDEFMKSALNCFYGWPPPPLPLRKKQFPTSGGNKVTVEAVYLILKKKLSWNLNERTTFRYDISQIKPWVFRNFKSVSGTWNCYVMLWNSWYIIHVFHQFIEIICTQCEHKTSEETLFL